MRVSVLINPKAGTVKEDLIERKVREALFRCELNFHSAPSTDSMSNFIKKELAEKTDVLMICGGDGTISTTLQILMTNEKNIENLPPICIIRSGTANDLAHEIGITERIDNAARLILEGKEKKIDVIEIEANGNKKYMLTNGGLGVPAETADKANKLRSLLQSIAADQNQVFFSKILSQYSYRLVKKMGSFVYIALLLETLRVWQQQGWDLEIEFSDGRKIKTIAPFVLVNNQPLLGKNFLTAPYTSNNDGLINLLLIQSSTRLSQLQEVFKVYTGQLYESDIVKIHELSEFTIRTRNKNRKITFFGDGEILFRDVDEIKIRALHQALTVMVQK
ncbi:MAG: diacylglycerol kinase family protein [Bdellovibrionota bacterium]